MAYPDAPEFLHSVPIVARCILGGTVCLSGLAGYAFTLARARTAVHICVYTCASLVVAGSGLAMLLAALT